ncbi:PaRep2a protein [Pyrobaculum aerophilum]|uniref:PaRep2a protein n=1 Tax=Pyrobaculum aerophilum TaxID=13773 RepID=UPI002161E204|nr:PaRep2a protein [Pyrobaculum aerophilum]
MDIPRLPQYFADALYELSAKYEVEITQDAIYVNGVEVGKGLCVRPTVEGCVRGIAEFLKNPPREALKSERAWVELRDQIYDAVAQWHKQCFGREPPRVGEVVKRLEEYVAMCQLYKAIKKELEGRASLYASDFSLRRVFWWDGEWGGRAVSCLVAEREAICTWGSAKWKFAVRTGKDGVYVKPESPLYQEWIKVAHRGNDS